MVDRRQAAPRAGTLERKLTPYFAFRSVLRGADMILRRAEEGAVKCALRDLRRLLLTEVEYFISACRFEGTRRALHLKEGERPPSARVLRHFGPNESARDPYPRS